MASRAEALASDKPRRRLGPARGSTPPPTVYDDPVTDDALPVARDGSPGEMALETWWTFWGRGMRPAKKNDWQSSRLHEFTTAEAFWRLEKALEKPSAVALPKKFDYQLFREAIQPTWEDPSNAKGGTWSVELPRKGSVLDDCWLKLELAAVGGTLVGPGEDPAEVCGVALKCNRGRDTTLSVWTRGRDAAVQQALGERFRRVLDVGPDFKITFAAHDDPAVLFSA